MKKIWLSAFALVSLLNMIGVAMENKGLIYLTKPLLMPLLALWLTMETLNQPPRFLKKMVFAGLAFGTMGDILLLNGDQPLFFMLGLIAFLFNHLSYIGGFSSVSNFDKGYLRQQPSWVLPFVLFPAGLLWWLWDGIPDPMKLPVGIYASVITVMALSVVNLRGHVVLATYRVMTAGALLFMLSDSILAAGRFGSAIPASGIFIMATYIAGQFLIVKGVRDHLLHHPVHHHK